MGARDEMGGGRPAPKGAAASRLLTVSQLNQFTRKKLESWGDVLVQGEISDLSRPPSGHLYFKLNDQGAQIQVVMYATDAIQTRADMRNGELIRVRAKFAFYVPRGALQLTAYQAEPAGEGDKRAQLERLRKKLAQEGLFDPARKRRPPLYPRVVGLVTSQAGAALHDVVQVASARAPVRWIVAHCQVQGPDAAASIVRALSAIYRFRGVEVVILARGGGASDDLSAFNDEGVARAVHAAPVPLVTGVGHEVDVTLADLVADVRAATPSNAAERVVPDAASLRRMLDDWLRRVQQAQAARQGALRLALDRFERRLRDPRRAMSTVRARFDDARLRLERGERRRLTRARERLAALTERLVRHDPRASLARDRARFEALAARITRVALIVPRHEQLQRLSARLSSVMAPRAERERQRLLAYGARLHALSPLAVLSRGYAIALDEESGRAVLDASSLTVGTALELRFASGRARVEVRELLEEKETT